ncbi:MAG TPA: HAMP domain-containing sensor histidine kinase [Dongiaceae bacterium]|nr:HAMP domain-containing sensor histidine kinase [Dongiaceae bacterium]
MSFRTKLFLLFLVTVLASVSAVTYSVTHYTRQAYEEADAQRTQALVEQFRKEFAQQGEIVAHDVENVTNSETTLKMAIDLDRPNADQSTYLHDAAGAAQEHGLNFMEFVIADGTLISSAQYPARVGYKETWVTNGKDWNGSEAFLRREELPNEVAVALTAVRTQPNVSRPFYVIGGKRLDKKFLGALVAPAGMRTLLYLNLNPTFTASDITGAGEEVEQPERFAPMIAQIQKQPAPLVETIQWTDQAESAEAFHVLPLTGRNGELLGALLVGSSRRELVLLTRHIMKLAAAVAGAAIVIGLLLTWWVSARITRPIEQLAEGAREVAAGNWDTRIQLSGSDETGQLATAFNNMTAKLASQRERLVQTERVAAWRELARRLAHELRNPLFPLQITVENMQRARQLAPAQFQEVFNESTATLKAELANLNTIVSRFSDFSKMPAPEFSQVDVSEAIRGAVRLFEPQFHEVGKPNIATEYFLKDGLEIDADPDLLHKALQNLVLNGLDAMPAGGTLTFRTFDTPGGVRIEVSDTGKGLTPEECSRLFTPYYTTKQQGTGLGLAIVQSVVSDHRGTISVASEEGHGTTFRIELPKHQPGVTTKKAETPVSAAHAGSPKPETTAAASD